MAVSESCWYKLTPLQSKVYFADSSSKSANYCHADHDADVGFCLLCEVLAVSFAWPV